MGTSNLVLLIHTSDIHLGVDRYVKSPLWGAYIDVFMEIGNRVLESGSRYFVISGDMFNGTTVGFDVLINAIRVLRDLREKGVRVIVVPGNHDNSPTGRSVLNILAESGLIYLLKYEEIHDYLLSRPLVFNDDKVVFYGIPGFRNMREVEYLRNNHIKYLDIYDHRDYEVILVAHTNVKIHGYDPTRFADRYGKITTDEVELHRNIPPETRYIALGHIHLPLPIEREFYGSMAYPGTPIGMDINDLRETARLIEKGFRRRVLMVDTSRKPPYVKSIDLVQSPFVKTLKIDVRSEDELLNGVKEILDKAIVTESKYNVLIIHVTGLEKINMSIENTIRETAFKRNIHIELRPVERGRGLDSGLFLSDINATRDMEYDVEKTLGEIIDLEEKILREISSTGRVSIPLSKLKWLIDRLSEPISSDVKIEELLVEIEKELSEG